MQRCVFLLDPFFARRWRRRYDLLISLLVWVVVSLACSPFILMRSSSSSSSSTSIVLGTQTVYNLSYSLDTSSTQLYAPTMSTSPSISRPDSNSTKEGCFKDLPIRRLPLSLAVTMMALAELFGFLIPLVCIVYSSIRIAGSLNQRQTQDRQNSTTPNSSARSRLQSVTSVNCQADKNHEKQTNGEKQRALRMVLSCTALFLFCFGPYHINFLLYLMVSQNIVSNCATSLAVRQFHPVSLCLASLSCCLNPLLYYFLTAEFRQHLTIRTASFSSSLLSSPISSTIQRPAQQRLMTMESNCSEWEVALEP